MEVNVYDYHLPVDMDVSYDYDLNLFIDFEPSYLKEGSYHDEQKQSLHKEYDYVVKNATQKLVDPLLGTKRIGRKQVFKKNDKEGGSLDKNKVKFVGKGFSQKEGVSYEETFSPIEKWAIIETFFALPTQNGQKFHQMDVKTTFLNGDIKEYVFMSQPEEFVVKVQQNKV